MKPVAQTILTVPGGDCFRACIASIFELPIEALPNPQDPELAETPMGSAAGWWIEWQSWLAKRNLTMYTWEHTPGGWIPQGYALLAADSPRGPWLHSVVCHDGKIVWDPSPYREQGVGEWREWTVFGLLDPSKPIGLTEVPV